MYRNNTRKQYNAIIFVVISCFGIRLSAQQIGHTTVTYTDASRGNRQIATEVYYPATTAGTNTPIVSGVFPLIVCGHGFVMTWDAYQNLWTALVPKGYILAFPTTEGGLAPVHADFGLDLKFLVTAIQNTGAGTSVPASAVGNRAAIMGHSMGGGSAFLAAQNNTTIATMVSFAAANTNPPSITASKQVTVPTLLFSGANDCVAPPAQHQDKMYDSTGATYKTQVYLTGGGHCYFAENNLNCSFGEATCTPSPAISRVAQQATTNDFLSLWLAYYLKNDCAAAQAFQDSLISSPRITYRQKTPIACTASTLGSQVPQAEFSVYPNPVSGTCVIRSNYKADRLCISDVTGRDMLTILHPEPEVTLHLSGLAPGMYLITLSGQQGNLPAQKQKIVLR